MERIEYKNYDKTTLREFLQYLKESGVKRVFDKKIIGHVNTQNFNVYKQNENEKLILVWNETYDELHENLDKKLKFVEVSFKQYANSSIEINYEFKESEDE